MDIDKLIEHNQRFDAEFEQRHPDFVRWFLSSKHSDLDPKFRISPRVAWKCQCYHEEFLEAKQIGLI